MQYSHGQVRRMFDRIAHRYDLLNRVLSAGMDRRWRHRMVRSCRQAEHPRILDVATGTGDVLEATDPLSPVLRTGVDLSGQMLARARRKLNGRETWLVQGAVETLPFRSGAFDLVLVAFGVRNFSVRAQGFREMLRVLRPGGQLRILEFSRPRGIFWHVYRPYFRLVLPRIGRLVSGDRDAYTYLPDTVMTFPEPDALGRELERAGFHNVSWQPLTQGIVTLYAAESPDTHN